MRLRGKREFRRLFTGKLNEAEARHVIPIAAHLNVNHAAELLEVLAQLGLGRAEIQIADKKFPSRPVCGELLISPESAIRHTQAALSRSRRIADSPKRSAFLGSVLIRKTRVTHHIPGECLRVPARIALGLALQQLHNLTAGRS